MDTAVQTAETVEQKLARLEAEVAKLHRKHELHREISEDLIASTREFKASTGSRRGLDGISPKFSIGSVTSGEKAAVWIDNNDPSKPVLSFVLPQGEPGKALQAEIRTLDGKIQLVESGKAAAEIIAIPGPAGRDGKNGIDGKSVVGPKGETPSISEIVHKVVAHITALLS